ncbi:AraC family transcriptional regulator [Polaribacter pacificus]|uniref:AraC family transcriptional regulator n=1 Tax=Polaribacter pacificus TaxID=1775173 RepID=A0A917I2V7_9FLAO|nr:AraC family transcriptional regulator [Polaribacter pacificus]GGH03966.1 AraC family transcriptional regulator [Polaribacter pacificus]
MKEKLKILDSLEVLSFQNKKTKHPSHFHDTYCISLIEKGVLVENELIASTGKILISNPYEIHNNLSSENISFSTFYVNQDVIDFISPFNRTSFQDKVIENPLLHSSLKNLLNFIKEKKEKKNFVNDFYDDFNQFIFQLTINYGAANPYNNENDTTIIKDLKIYISDNLNTQLSLIELSKMVGMSKFQFIRWFKFNIGLTPFEYILLKKVEYGKTLIKQGIPLVEAALDSGFYDQSNFSNYFKKYIGMSPNSYKQSCNIFQDSNQQ